MKHRSKNYLRDWEISLIKTMLEDKRFNKQQIQSYFSRPGRSINQARFHEIKQGKYPNLMPASSSELETFLKKWTLVKIPGPDTYKHIAADDDIYSHLRAFLRAIKLKILS